MNTKTNYFSAAEPVSHTDFCRFTRMGQPAGDTYAPRSARNAFGQYTLLWVTQNETTLWVDTQPFRGCSSRLFLIRPGQVYRWERHHGLQGYEISFSGDFLSEEEARPGSSFLNTHFRLFAQQELSLAPDAVAPLKDLIEKMIQEWGGRHRFGVDILKRYLAILLISIGRNNQNQRDTAVSHHPGAQIFERFATLLEKDYRTKKMVADYAESLCVTPNYLNEVVKKITGRSAGVHIRRRVVLEAQRTAMCSTQSMKEIAYMLGFSDPCHFSKFFKKTTGVTFLDYKKNNIAAANYYSL